MSKTRLGESSDTTPTEGFISRNSSSTLGDQNDQDLAIDREGSTKLHLAAKTRDLAEVQRLYNKGLSFRDINHEDYTPFHFAVLGGSIEVMEWMLSSDPEAIKQHTAYGYSVLHLAAQSSNLNAIIWLLQHGANPKDTNNGSQDYLDILIQYIPKDQWQYLPTHDATAQEAVESLGVVLEIGDLTL